MKQAKKNKSIIRRRGASKTAKSDKPGQTAKQFMDKLFSLRPKNEIDYIQKFFKDDDKNNKCLGVRMSNTFALAKEFSVMPLHEIEKLLDSEYYEAMMGAVSIIDFQARDKKIQQILRKNYLICTSATRTMLRYAIEKLDKKQKDYYMNAGKYNKRKKPSF